MNVVVSGSPHHASTIRRARAAAAAATARPALATPHAPTSTQTLGFGPAWLLPFGLGVSAIALRKTPIAGAILGGYLGGSLFGLPGALIGALVGAGIWSL